jgi:anti-sigma-K factor RskA
VSDDDRSDGPGDASRSRAAEYVLGLLSPAERAQVERDLERDFALRREVYYWQDRLFPMTRIPDPTEPSAALWPRIAKSLRRDAPRAGWWASLALWRAVTAGAVAAAIVLGVRIATPPVQEGRYLAVLQDDQKVAGWIVEAQAGGTVRLVPLANTPVPAQKAIQFWTKPQTAAAPTSLGLVPGDRATEIPAARLPALEPEQLFELTLEPETGSPTGRPTGPILFVGRAVAMR